MAATPASSAIADAAADLAGATSAKLKTVGVDTEVMAGAAKKQATELQRLLVEEVANRPFQALALAAAVGFFYGLRLR
jgi:ElaB/YqjD/DUF883 family membrane-anchored ribosome-binding protein